MHATIHLPGSVETRVSNQPEQVTPDLFRAVELRVGELCPVCEKASLDYNGLLELACPNCSYSLGGGHTW